MISLAWQRTSAAVALLVLVGCGHDDELASIAAARAASQRACIELVTPLQDLRIGALRDSDPASLGVQLPLTVRVADQCEASVLSAGLCTEDSRGALVAPAVWPTTLPVEPSREYGIVLTLPQSSGRLLPCASFDRIYSFPIERVCDGGEVFCMRDATCWSDTQTNPARCGGTCSECPAGDHGVPACVDGRCALACAEGYRYEAGACRPRPSCTGQALACKGQDCCAQDWIAAPEGGAVAVDRGYDSSMNRERLPEAQAKGAAPAIVDPYYMDRYEVTVGRFRRFVDGFEAWRAAGNPRAQQGAHPRIPGSGWRDEWTVAMTPFDPLPVARTRAELVAQITGQSCSNTTSWREQPGDQDDLAINCVSFLTAYMFCIWDGDSVYSRLPSEAEWNAAAAGGSEQRAFPWSSPPDSLEFAGRAVAGQADRLPFSVGSFPTGAGLWNTLDLAGNLYEWSRDASVLPAVFPHVYVPGPANPLSLTNDANIDTPRVLRGGSFKNFACPTCDGRSSLRTAARISLPPYDQYNDTGIRCVRTYL